MKDMMMTQAPDIADIAIRFTGVVKRFGVAVAVDGIDLAIRKGELVTLLGPSGCGKTTTLRLIAGLDLPSAGQVLIAGRDVSREPASGRNVGMVFQSYALFPHMSVLDNVAYGPVIRGTRKREAHDRARDTGPDRAGRVAGPLAIRIVRWAAAARGRGPRHRATA